MNKLYIYHSRHTILFYIQRWTKLNTHNVHSRNTSWIAKCCLLGSHYAVSRARQYLECYNYFLLAKVCIRVVRLFSKLWSRPRDSVHGLRTIASMDSLWVIGEPIVADPRRGETVLHHTTLHITARWVSLQRHQVTVLHNCYQLKRHPSAKGVLLLYHPKIGFLGNAWLWCALGTPWPSRYELMYADLRKNIPLLPAVQEVFQLWKCDTTIISNKLSS